MSKKQKKPSYLDATLADKVQHEDLANAKRVINIDNVVEQYWSRVDVTYNGNGSATNSKFYTDTLQEITKIIVTADTAGNLNNKYFLINSGLDNTEYYVWYNVGSTGTDPALVGKIGVQIPINFNESAGVVALATKLLFESTAGADFSLKQFSDTIVFNALQYGETTDSSDINTGFTVDVTRQGESELVLDYDIPQQTGIRYVYNEIEKEFEAFNTDINITLNGLAIGGKVTEVTLNSTTWTALPITSLVNRNAIGIQNLSGIEIKLNYQSSGGDIDTDSPGYTGIVIANGDERTYDITDSIVIYAKSESGTPTINVEELA